ncbi:hypothetical protein SDC9_148017 [bioreactor metagenome]|uniref:Maltogenic Amylase C-terminal domain-containing protein n=1 Tax=bioreactor metagenome TaxID=1076179 RepID=A0A645EI44_9ZZZZ
MLRWLPGGEQAILFINRSEREQRLTLHPDDLPQGPDGETPISLREEWADVLTGETANAVEGALTIALPPLTARLYRATKS